MPSTTSLTPPTLTIGDITLRLPIIQGGMGVGISMAGLASAVAAAGGLGVIAAVQIGIIEADFHLNPLEATLRALRQQVQTAKDRSGGGPIGVNVMVALNNYDIIVKAAAEAGADIIISGAGLPLRLPGLVPEGTDPALVPIVSSGRAAGIVARRWVEHYDRAPDAVVVEGPLAGGHLGFKPEQIDDPRYALENLVPEVIEALRPFRTRRGTPIPVIAAGGVYTGADIYRFIKMGAAGVQMGTRFVATHECDASDRFKQAYLAATKDDVTIIQSPVGLPGRALKGRFIERSREGKKRPYTCTYHCLKACDYHKAPYCISMALINAQKGYLDAGFVFCGANVWRVDRLVSVQELMDELEAGYREAAARDQAA
ncbi:nitronate monooxygenase [Dissulfurirhabdus thermomarina]|uniref:Nitronate monooxygenase n=1 Tax=Dissulfurirhabdus thermomarina TaxID=1765737 RepID=A0A6N9TLX5_DISTH|nr:nitronate monooxygenase family protein [Dissulfurirhabdus thermomarina]NDY42119.1 nitronate monooxygenase [Dissulfurirhabdus thermomarina]NMX22859.1 nitronate monooxygenase [Dissulfurirhabdus thermomarina]